MGGGLGPSEATANLNVISSNSLHDSNVGDTFISDYEENAVQGAKVKVTATLKGYNDKHKSVTLGWRYLNFYLYNYNDQGTLLWSASEMTNLITETATATIDTKKLNLPAGTYLIHITYNGNSKMV